MASFNFDKKKSDPAPDGPRVKPKAATLPPRGSGPLLPKQAAKASRKRAINDLLTGAKKQPPANLTPLKTEDSTNGYWDATKRGNGGGRSFYDVDGELTFLDPPPAKPKGEMFKSPRSENRDRPLPRSAQKLPGGTFIPKPGVKTNIGRRLRESPGTRQS